MNYNLVDEKWLPVLRNNGKVEKLSLLDTLTEAHTIREIACSNPMDRFAVYRFLLTLFYWKADALNGITELRNSLLEGKVPEVLISDFRSESDSFDLFHDRKPFLQDLNVKDDKQPTIGYLFAELATGTNIAHFHHGDDKQLTLCLACIALGMIRVIPWTQSGGQGKTPSIHGAPPIMAMAVGNNLAETLGLNLVPLSIPAGKPKWTGQFVPSTNSKEMPYLEAFTWNPRRIRLPQQPQNIALCWLCGEENTLGVHKFIYAKNDNTKGLAKDISWKDPAAFYPTIIKVSKKKKIKSIKTVTVDKASSENVQLSLFGEDEQPASQEAESKETEIKTLKSDSDVRASIEHDLMALFREDMQPVSQVVNSNEDHLNWTIVIPTTDSANNKTFDHRARFVEVIDKESVKKLAHPKVKIYNEVKTHEGWKKPNDSWVPKHIYRFVNIAIESLDNGDWAILRNASFKSMHDTPDAFDAFSSVYWSLNGEKPYKNVAWLLLKLMAFASPSLRAQSDPNGINPLDSIQKALVLKRTISNKNSKVTHEKTFSYPIALPTGNKLEAVLRDEISKHVNSKLSKTINWAGLCHCLNQLIKQQ